VNRPVFGDRQELEALLETHPDVVAIGRDASWYAPGLTGVKGSRDVGLGLFAVAQGLRQVSLADEGGI